MELSKSQQFKKRQQEYAKELLSKGEMSYTIIAADTFVEGMRSSGYKSTARAIDEFVDNSEQSLANRIDIIYTSDTIDKRKIITNIAVMDDGLGMINNMLRACVVWGGTDRFNDRNGFGRFGFGLPSAAVSITRQFEVYSKVKEELSWKKVYVDLDQVKKQIASGDNAYVNETVESELPEFIKEYRKKNKIDYKQGTIVLLKNPDQLTSGFRNPTAFHKNMMEHLGLVYRNTINNCEIFVNGDEVKAVDPLFLTTGARFFDVKNGIIAENTGEDCLEFRTTNDKVGKLRIKYSFLPYNFQNGPDDGVNPRFKVMKENHAFFIICRAGRQIDTIRVLNFPSENDNVQLVNYDRNWVIEIDFEPILDEEFGITVNKQQVTLSEKLWEFLALNNLPEQIAGLRKKFRQSRNRAKAENGKKGKKISEIIVAKVEEDGFIQKASDVYPNKEADANQLMEKDAEDLTKKLGGKKEEHFENIKKKAFESPYSILFEESEGGDFYWIEQYGPQMRLYINIRHRFYTDIYSKIADERIKTALELLLFSVATCELKAKGKKEEFYKFEKSDWSKRLNSFLLRLDEVDSIEHEEEAQEEEDVSNY